MREHGHKLEHLVDRPLVPLVLRGWLLLVALRRAPAYPEEVAPATNIPNEAGHTEAWIGRDIGLFRYIPAAAAAIMLAVVDGLLAVQRLMYGIPQPVA